MIEISKDDFETIAICALRYCQGRRTYMPDLVRAIITPHLEELSNNTITIMLDDCEMQERFDLYGDDIDKPGWLEWRATLESEAKRRGLMKNSSKEVNGNG